MALDSFLEHRIAAIQCQLCSARKQILCLATLTCQHDVQDLALLFFDAVDSVSIESNLAGNVDSIRYGS